MQRQQSPPVPQAHPAVQKQHEKNPAQLLRMHSCVCGPVIPEPVSVQEQRVSQARLQAQILQHDGQGGQVLRGVPSAGVKLGGRRETEPHEEKMGGGKGKEVQR